MSKHLPPHPNLKQLKVQAKDLRKAFQAADAESIERLKAHLPRLADVPEDEIRNADVSLVDFQHVVAREYGFESWNWLRAVVDVDFGLLNRLADQEVQILLREVDNPVLILALQSADDDVDNARPCPEGLQDRVLVRRPVEEMSVDDIAELSSRLTLQARRLGILSLPAVIEETVDPFLREGLQLAVDGAEPNRVRSVLEGRLQPENAEQEKARRPIIQGIVSTQMGDNPGCVARTIRQAADEEVASANARDERSASEVRRHIDSETQGGTQMDKELDFVTDLLAQFLGKGDPQTIARIHSRLDTTLPAVLRRLPGAMRGEVVYQLFQLRVGEYGLLRWAARDLGGVEEVAKILNCSGASTERNVLDFLDDHDPRLAEEIRNQMFTFKDIARLPDQHILEILEKVDGRDMAMALRGVGEKVKDRFLSNMSDADPLDLSASSRTRVEEEMAAMGPVRVLDVEDAQLRIVQQARLLEEQGRIPIACGEGDYIL